MPQVAIQMEERCCDCRAEEEQRKGKGREDQNPVMAAMPPSEFDRFIASFV